MDVDTAVVSDRKGSIAVLSSSDRLESKFYIKPYVLRLWFEYSHVFQVVPIKCPVISNCHSFFFFFLIGSNCHSSLKKDCIQVCENPTFAFGNGEDNV
jgi:hypothetical protein